jgi:hypothetical protein
MATGSDVRTNGQKSRHKNYKMEHRHELSHQRKREKNSPKRESYLHKYSGCPPYTWQVLDIFAAPTQKRILVFSHPPTPFLSDDLFLLVGWNFRYCPAPDDRWWWLWRNWWNEDWQGNRSTRRNLPQRHFVHHKSHMTRPGSKPGPPRVGSQRLTAWAMARPSDGLRGDNWSFWWW